MKNICFSPNNREWEDEQAHDRNAMQCPAPACFARINLRVHLPASLAGVWGCDISHGSMSSTGNVVVTRFLGLLMLFFSCTAIG
ncbi:hypothetical protein I7I48_10307 [Histoplasma ohiense]|nr:hypothetical protein I7I48_10307 [Histoplasma ohiense (nom. inval.)]